MLDVQTFKRSNVQTFNLPAWLLIAVLALLHGLLYVLLVPPWQVPDEPAQFEYAALTARLGRVPNRADADPALSQRIADSLVRQRFFEYLEGHPPEKPVHSLEDARELFFMPRQVGNDPPLYFVLTLPLLRVLATTPIETQLVALRLLGILFVAGAALCAYAAAREFLAGDRGFALAVGALVAFQPMFVFASVGAGDDGLANLIGAALCWAAIRAARRGLSVWGALTLLALALLGMLAKRSLLPAALPLALAGCWLAIRWVVRTLLNRGPYLALCGALLLALIVGGRGALAAVHDQTAAADWNNMARELPARRVLAAPGTGRAALEVPLGEDASQVLPGIAAEWAQNQELHFSARMWTAGAVARGRLVIDYGWAVVEAPFAVTGQEQVVQMHTFIPLYCPYVRLAIDSDQGPIYADQLIAESDRRRGLNLLSNSDLAAPALPYASPLARLAGYLRLRELAWVWRSGRLAEPPPLGWDLGRIFFVSFWGQFGWMSLPLVGATPWELALALICGGGLFGTVVWLIQPARLSWHRPAVVLLWLFVGVGLAFPLLNAYTQTRDQVLQQGRYLFPALAPLALLLALGWRAFVPPRWRPGALGVWLAWWVAFAAAALGLIVRFYMR